MVTNKVTCVKHLSVLYDSATGSTKFLDQCLLIMFLLFLVRVRICVVDVSEIHRGRVDTGVISVRVTIVMVIRA